MEKLEFSVVTLKVTKHGKEKIRYYKDLDGDKLLSTFYSLEKEAEKVYIEKIETEKFYNDFIKEKIQNCFWSSSDLFETLKEILCDIESFKNLSDDEKLTIYNYWSDEIGVDGIYYIEELENYLNKFSPMQAFKISSSACVSLCDEFFTIGQCENLVSFNSKDIGYYFDMADKSETFQIFVNSNY